MIVTRRQLTAMGACLEQRESFTQTFGAHAQVEVNEENLLRAARAGLDIAWWFSRTFPRPLVDQYWRQPRVRLQARYNRRLVTLQAEVDEQLLDMLEEHDRRVHALSERRGTLQQLQLLWEQYYRRKGALHSNHRKRIRALQLECTVVPVVWKLIQTQPTT